MVWDRIKKAGEQGLSAVKSIGEQVNKAAQGAQDLAVSVKDGSLKLLNDAGNSAVQAGSYALQTLEGSYIRVTTSVQNGITDLDEGLHSVRNTIARDLKSTVGSVAGGAGAAGELVVMGGLLSLGGVGILAYPLVEGAADNLVKRAASGVSDPLVSAIRSKRPEFLDIFVVEAGFLEGIIDDRPRDVLAMIYMPRHEGADADGIILIGEEALFHLTRSNQPEREANLYQKALDAVVRRKEKLGLDPLRPVLIREAVAIAQARRNGLDL